MGQRSHNRAGAANSKFARLFSAPVIALTIRSHARPRIGRRRAFAAKWFATGDEYLRDEDGFYHHCGRSDDMLKVSGLWVSPSEIEDMLAGIPTVREAAAVLREGAAGLSEIVLYIVATSSAEGGAAIAAARAQLTRNLPAFKLPRQYALAVQLPRTPTGKIQHYKLRAELQRSA